MSADTVACVSIDITVRGSFAVFERAERGIVHAVIGYESPEMRWTRYINGWFMTWTQ
jgi:hypothetical protein